MRIIWEEPHDDWGEFSHRFQEAVYEVSALCWPRHALQASVLHLLA